MPNLATPDNAALTELSSSSGNSITLHKSLIILKH